MPFIEFFQQQPLWFYMVATLLGLTVGSFLNVVIYRLPVMLQRQWQAECAELSGQEPAQHSRFDLTTPGSRCPQCESPIRAWQNIPVLSYLLLRGKCANCDAAISPRYPIIEAMTGLLSLAVALHFGPSGSALAALLLTWSLIALTWIDIDHHLLPDNITLPLVWIGLLLSLSHTFTDPGTAIIGAVTGYMSLWVLFHLFRLLTGKEGMGYGDFKLFAVFGAWLGWQYLPQIILLSSLVGALIGIAMILLRGRDRNIPIPFGPYLAIAGWISLLWGERINQTYLQLAGLN